MALRFATVRDLYDTFPTAKSDVGTEGGDVSSLDFLRSLLAQGRWPPAVSFCAYLLPRREAVWWGCQSVRRMPRPHGAQTEALEAAEAWVRMPEEELRRRALDLGARGDPGMASTWMALGAGWSGGTIAPPEYGLVPAAADQTARAVRTGLLIGMSSILRDDTDRIMKPCIESAIELALGRAR
jgi:hypothetical protein